MPQQPVQPHGAPGMQQAIVIPVVNDRPRAGSSGTALLTHELGSPNIAAPNATLTPPADNNATETQRLVDLPPTEDRNEMRTQSDSTTVFHRLM
ncbi:hypothetical protein QS306_14040 [Paraburkholderia bonniea]|uniref:hypothetical protein n=1 Tax=Paraburkholderia bonniea TaxID=2152891 RepID=UPI0012921E48|nr:hypothetical protein [Paraburkholderia bonniea]WJF91893.1 hypothetical protein QS306_14040 [Paraburkholderia bonniea]WJF95212.1 hypothetical protein QS308_14045 [Paraburkholderia bonniea]